MFKIESYLTPYISAYLARYVKNFNTDDFQVSFWQGGATFNNVNLNLEALEAELNLPAVTLVSGHIHELKINVPWTKITSEPITVHVNTIEIVLKLKGPNDATNLNAQKRALEKKKSEVEPPPTYIQNLTNKILQNVEVVFTNVVLKYTEDDIVLSLNIRKAALKCVNSRWEPAFVELSAPEFILRKCWTCSDLTICLDKTNNVGKIETYMEPLLYKCSFDVRVFHQFHGPYVKSPYFSRYDLYLGDMQFSIADEQIPMVLRLYNLIRLLTTIENYQDHRTSKTGGLTALDDEKEDKDDESVGWASWAFGWVPTIPEAIFGPMDESMEPLPACEFSVPVVHYGIFVDRATIILKTIERVCDKPSYYRSTPRIKFSPFLKCQLQGIASDTIFRGPDINTKLGVSEFQVHGVGFCPCGLNDCTVDQADKLKSLHEFIRIGKTHDEFASQSMFNLKIASLGEVRPPGDYHFKWEGHIEEYTEEKMLNRTPGIALEMLDLSSHCIIGSEGADGDNKSETNLSVPYSICRLVVAPLQLKICSSLIHRAKLVNFVAGQFTDNQYDHLRTLVYRKSKRYHEDTVNCSAGRTLYTFQFTILRPKIEIFSGDHPDYDSISHIRAHYRKRICTTVTPLSQVLKTWPKLTIICDTIDGKSIEPTLRFRRLVESSEEEILAPDLISSYSYKFKTTLDNVTVEVTSAEFTSCIVDPFSINFLWEYHLKPTLCLSSNQCLELTAISTDSLKLQVSKPNLMLCHVILTSCLNENASDHLTSTSLLEDLTDYRDCCFILQLTNASYQFSRTSSTISYHVFLNSASAFVTYPQLPNPLQIFEGCVIESTPDEVQKGGLLEFFIQYPFNGSDTESENTTIQRSITNTSMCILKTGSFKTNFYLQAFEWLSYYPRDTKQLSSTSISNLKMSSHSLFPISPLSTTRLDNISSRSSEADKEDLRSSSSASVFSQNQSFTGGIRDTYSRSQASVHRTDISSTNSYKTTQEEFPFPDRTLSIEEEMLMCKPQPAVESWETWIADQLAIFKNTMVILEVNPGVISFPVLKEEKLVPVEACKESLVIKTPKIAVRPEALSIKSVDIWSKTVIDLPEEIKCKPLYPLRIHLNDISGFTVHNGSEQLQFLSSVTVGVTLTLSEKKLENKSSALALCLHCDIPPVKLTFTSLQVKLLVHLLENFIQTASVFRTVNVTLFLAKSEVVVNSALEVKKQLSNTVMGSSGFSSSWSATKPLIPRSSESSIYESVDVPVTPIGDVKLENLNTTTAQSSNKKKASLWVQITLTQFQFVLRNGETVHSSDITNQLILDIEDIVSSVDVQSVYMKVNLKIGALSLRCYERQNKGKWDFGNCMGVILSSGDEITGDIDVVGSEISPDINQDEEEQQPAPSSTKKHGFLYVTFTRVLAMNFHQKSDVSSPAMKWAQLLQKHYNYGFEDEENKKMLNEFDIKMRKLDILLCPTTFLPFQSIIQSFLTLNLFPKNSNLQDARQNIMFERVVGENSCIPYINNNTLPMIYIETEMIRIFMKAAEQEQSESMNDVLLIQIASINLISQTENPLHRFLIKPDLYMLAEKANILNIPGSPVEDRQYQLDIHDLSIVSCNWRDIETNSRCIFTNRSTVLLRAMGENPAFEWNKIQDHEETSKEVVAFLLLDRMDISVTYASPIVYERNSNWNSTVIAGQVFELNVTSRLSLHINDQQLSCVKSFTVDCAALYDICTLNSEKKACLHDKTHISIRMNNEVDKVKSSLAPISGQSSSTELDSGIDLFKKITPSQSTHYNPTDVLVTCSFIEIQLYEICNPKSSFIQLKPLLYFSFTQPHWIMHVSTFKQNMEFSTFDLNLGYGMKTSTYLPGDFALPNKEDYSMKIISSIHGNHNPKTGMIEPYFTLKLIDFLLPSGKMSIDLFRPTKINISVEFLEMCQQAFDVLSGNSEVKTDENLNQAPSIRRCCFMFSQLEINSNQIVVCLKTSSVPVSSLTFGLATMKTVISNKKKFVKHLDELPDNVAIQVAIGGITLASKLRDRSHIIVSPWNFNAQINFQWYTWLEKPMIVLSLSGEPMSIYFGPENVLATLEIYRIFKKHLIAKETNSSQPEMTEETKLPQSQTFTDDLRAGTFKYSTTVEYSELPELYDILFCEARQTMTWRYPQPRYLSKVEACPVPLSPSSDVQSRSLDCSIEYWDEAQCRFLTWTSFTLSETKGVNAELPGQNCVSAVWRVSIITSLDEDESKSVVRPELLAACLRVDSVFNPKLVQKLNVIVEIPRIIIHFVNHLPVMGCIPDKKLSYYSFGGVIAQDQTFSSVELSSTTLSLNCWFEKSTMNFMSYAKYSVLDYTFLTESVAIDPFIFQIKLNWIEDGISDINIIAKPIVVKVGHNTLHTVASSCAIWKQILSSPKGQQIELSSYHDKPSKVLSQIVFCNDTTSTLNISQEKTNVTNNLLTRQCYGFVWPSSKAETLCKVRMNGEVAWSKPFGLKTYDYFTRKSSSLPIFIKSSKLSASQTMVTLSGALTVANALNESISVSVATKYGNKENAYTISGRSHGPSFLVNISEVKQLQFKFSNFPDNKLPWSNPVELGELRKSKNHAVAVSLSFFDERTASLVNYNVWCSLVEESIENTCRCLIIICPLFRVKSSLAAPTLTHISTGRGDVESSSLLQGKGSEMQVDFVGNLEATLHLTFQHCLTSKASHSKPTIPLNPNGPALERSFVPRPIDDILSQIRDRKNEETIWPFIGEDISLDEWVLTDTQPETEVQVEFTSWIQGLPTTLIDAKPWGLFVNLTGETILFSENVNGHKSYEIPSKNVFTPSKLRESFKLGIDVGRKRYWTDNMEFTEEKYRIDVHYVNSDWKIPIDCFSRLEICADMDTCYITLETRIRNGIVVLTIRPTYSIQNRTDCLIVAKALSLIPSILPAERDLKLHQNVLKLAANKENENNSFSIPVLLFHSVSKEKYSKTRDEIKFLAIGCKNSPMWFVQLMNFDLFFNNISAAKGIPGRRLTLSLQRNRSEGKLDDFVEATMPVTLSWICKNGQVWISIAHDISPQITFFNETKSSFLFAESSGYAQIPYKDNSHFKQYLELPCSLVGHFSLSSASLKFPELSRIELADENMCILLGKPNNLLVSKPEHTCVYYESSQIEWSNEILLKTGSHSFRIGDCDNVEHYQLKIEQLGSSFYIYIQEMSTTAISAKEIRERINSSMDSNLKLPSKGLVSNFTRTEEESELRSKSPIKWKNLSSYDPKFGTCIPQCRIYLPLLRFILTDDITSSHKKSELIGITLQELFVDVLPETDPNPLLTLHEQPQENIAIHARLGDFQVDNALYEEKKYDFPVIIKRENEYKPVLSRITLPFDNFDNIFGNIANENPLVEFTGVVGLSSTTERGLQKVWVNCQPFAVYFEDSFMYFIQPITEELMSVIYNGFNAPESWQSVEVQSPNEFNGSDFKDLDSSLSASPLKIRSAPCKMMSNIIVANKQLRKVKENVAVAHEAVKNGARLYIPPEILSIINEFSNPIRIQQIIVNPVTIFVTLRISKSFYLAVDHSPLTLSKFEAQSSVTTNLAFGEALAVHYLQGALFRSANSVRLLGSLELLGSPGSLARSVTTGVKDFVFYPIRGLFEGPAGFITGLTYGCSSLLTNVGSGTLTSVTNLAWSVSRNLDRLTLNQEEQLQREEDRRAPIDGISDGILNGLTGFGIRLLGAIGGLAQHPIESVIDNGASPLRLLAGFSRGVLGVFTKPIGGAVELVAMTGQGILTGAGWTPKLQRKHERIVEDVDSCPNSLLKCHWMLSRERDEETRILLLFDALQFGECSTTTKAESTPVSILLTTENLYIINTALDQIVQQIAISSIMVENNNDDNSILSLRPAPQKKHEATSLAEERLIDFVKGFSTTTAISATDGSKLEDTIHEINIEEVGDLSEQQQHEHQQKLSKMTTQQLYSFDLFVDPNSKSEFITLLKLAQDQANGKIFRIF